MVIISINTRILIQMTPTVYLLPGALTQLDKSHSPAISLCSERWSMTAIPMLNSPLAPYLRRFNAAARPLRFSRRVPLEQSDWGDALVLQCAKFILSLMKALVSTWLTLNEIVTLRPWRSWNLRLTCPSVRQPETLQDDLSPQRGGSSTSVGSDWKVS